MKTNASVIGIDPGTSGALAYYDGSELLIYDMPFFEVKKGKFNRKVIDVRGLKKILEEIPMGIWKSHVFIEDIHAMPGNAATTMFSFGEGYGALKATIILMDFSHTFIAPQVWKKSIGCTKDKDSSRRRASELMPQFSHNWDRKKDDGRAEAALIAYYGFNK